MTDLWFSTVELGDGIALIAEPPHVNLYLVRGSRRALLVDTGLGLHDVSAVTRRLTDLPVIAVNTHAHLDHRGGNRFFDDVRIHPAGVDELRRTVTAGELAWFPGYARKVAAGFAGLGHLDDNLFHLVDAAMVPRPQPAVNVMDSWQIPGGEPASVLADGQRIDLGGRSVEVIHAPGHSPDSVVLIDSASGALFAGDVLVAGVSYAHLEGADPEQFAASVGAVRQRVAGRLARILVAHTMRFDQPPDFLDEVIAGWTSVLAGQAHWREWRDMFGNPCRRTDFRRFSITLPP